VIAPTPGLGLRIAALIALAILYVIAFHYVRKYEADMLTERAAAAAKMPKE
jgi:hypothetical protein